MNENRSSQKLLLFQDLKVIIEKILSHHSLDIWSVHGGLQSLVQSLDAIFHHGIKPQAGLIGVVVDYWIFIRGLRWLDPTLASSIDNLSKLPAASPVKPKHTKSFNSQNRLRLQLTHGQQWIEKSLQERNISKQITVLLSDLNYVKDHYFDWAFLLDDLYSSAILICISALEQNSPALLANIPSSLFTRRSTAHNNTRLHRGFSASSYVTPELNSSKTSPSAKISPPVNNETTVTDPLNVGSEPEIISPTKQIRKNSGFRGKSSSFNFEYPRASYYPDDQSGEDMGLSSSKSVQSMRTDGTNKQTLQERLMPAGRVKQASESDSKNVSKARKPLFYESSDDEHCSPDDFDFLLTKTTEYPDKNLQLDLYYSTIEVKLDLEHSELPTTNIDTELIEDLPQATSEPVANLPDLVVSAEVSISSKMAAAEKLTDNKAELKPTEDAFKKTSKKVRAPRPHHRRSRSDHVHDLSMVTGSQYGDGLTCFDGSTRSMVKPSTSFSHFQTSSLYQTPPSASALTRSTSLMGYLKKQDLTTCADIDKENAHFDFSEILIGAIEQIKCQMKEDEENPPQSEGVAPQPEDFSSLPFSVSESYHSPVGSFISTDSTSTTALMSRSGLPLDLEKSPITSSVESSLRRSTASDESSKTESHRTAESIAIGLLQSFSDQTHVTTDDFDWLISEEDVPQKLLPLPKSTVVDPEFTSDQGIRIRGNQEWAPPRPQIIFNTPTKVKLKAAMAKQNNRCAGCGTFVEKEFMSRFRYCEYTGKYFCTCCHDNKMAVIPGNVLQKFDFTKHKVSNFADDLLMKMSADPLYNINDINPSLYKKAKQLIGIRDLRTQMKSLYKYLLLCRFANSPSDQYEDGLRAMLASRFPLHLLQDDIHVYSLTDLERTKNGELMEELKSAVDIASSHVTTCELCRSKGFLCEVCRSDDLLFPHQPISSSCQFCKSCFHKKCFVATSCPKCARLRKRKQVLEQIAEE